MRHSKISLSHILIVLAMIVAATAGFCIVPFWNYMAGRITPWEEDYFSSQDVSAAAISISDETVQELLNGNVSLEEFYDQVNFSSPLNFLQQEEQENPVHSTPVDMSSAKVPTPSSASSALSPDAAAFEAQPTATPSSAPVKLESSSATSSAPSEPQGTESNYEQKIKALIQRLYGVKARAESGLNQCIQSAYAEYHALPAEEQTQARKIAICFSKAGQLSSLQASCDREVNQIISEMRQVLTANGQSSALADSAAATYKNEKSAMYSTLMSRLYS